MGILISIIGLSCKFAGSASNAENLLEMSAEDMSSVISQDLLLNPDILKAIGSLTMLSPDGKSYAFDSRANGHGCGEVVATLIIKRLNDALTRGDPVPALIRETCLN